MLRIDRLNLGLAPKPLKHPQFTSFHLNTFNKLVVHTKKHFKKGQKHEKTLKITKIIEKRQKRGLQKSPSQKMGLQNLEKRGL
jgi:hypothetical protein